MESFGNIVTDSGDRFELTAENTSVYRHMGTLAVFDHVFISVGEGGIYLWKWVEGHDETAEAAIKAGAPIHDRLRRVHQPDEENYVREVTYDMYESESYPAEWDNLTI